MIKHNKQYNIMYLMPAQLIGLVKIWPRKTHMEKEICNNIDLIKIYYLKKYMLK